MSSDLSSRASVQNPWSRRSWLVFALTSLLIAVTVLAPLAGGVFAATDNDAAIAMRLADLLRSARTVISRNQDLINDPALGDKGLTGDKVLAEAIALHKEQTGEDPRDSDASTLEGKLLRAQMDSIVAVVDGESVDN